MVIATTMAARPTAIETRPPQRTRASVSAQVVGAQRVLRRELIETLKSMSLIDVRQMSGPKTVRTISER